MVWWIIAIVLVAFAVIGYSALVLGSRDDDRFGRG